MRHRVTATILSLVLFVPAMAGGQIEDRWADPDYQPKKFRKIIVLGISADREPRHQFENKFVSHLRGRDVMAEASYAVARDLTDISDADRDRILRHIEDESFDGAISVRVVPIKGGKTESEWAAQWKRWIEAGGTLRELVEESLPLAGEKARSYGVEVALWDTATRECIWAARTDTYSRKGLRKGAPHFVQMVMDALIAADLM